MYNKLMNINIVNKILFLLIFIVSFIFVRNIFILGFLISILLYAYIVGKLYGMELIFTASIFIFFRSEYYLLNFVISGLLIVSTIYLFVALFNSNDKRLILERLMYPNPKNGKKLIRIFYKKRLKVSNKMYYGAFKKLLTPYRNYAHYLNKEINRKTDRDLDDVYLYSRLRFYNFYGFRTNYGKNKWNRLDNTVFLLNVLVILIVTVWR